MAKFNRLLDADFQPQELGYWTCRWRLILMFLVRKKRKH